MKKILFIILIIFNTIIFSQNKIGLAIYGVNISTKEIQIKDKFFPTDLSFNSNFSSYLLSVLINFNLSQSDLFIIKLGYLSSDNFFSAGQLGLYYKRLLLDNFSIGSGVNLEIHENFLSNDGIINPYNGTFDLFASFSLNKNNNFSLIFSTPFSKYYGKHNYLGFTTRSEVQYMIKFGIESEINL